jgi:hypothetical protein
MKQMKSLCIVFTLLCSFGQPIFGQPGPSQTADLLIFSFNRPLQLYAVLESVEKYITNLNKIYVLYRRSSYQYEQAYQEVHQRFPQVTMVRQGHDPRGDFKPLLLQCFDGSSAEYIMFSVDDDIVKDYVDITRCVQAMQKYNAYGFYLRLGTNITKQYGVDIPLMIPASEPIEEDILRFRFSDGFGDWAYPNNVDMTIFKKSDIQSFFRDVPYSSPNTLESSWSGMANLDAYGLCYTVSKKFTLLLNTIQKDFIIAQKDAISTQKLFIKWRQNFVLDISQFDHIYNDRALMEYQPVFISRN